MNSENGPSLIWGAVCIALLVSSLVARRLPLGQVAKIALAWTAIFAAFFVVFSFRFELASVWDRVKSDFGGTAGQSVVGEAIELKRQDDGHYWVQAEINGQATSFLVDSGATTTAINATTAAETGIKVDGSRFPVIISTANGQVTASRANIKSLAIGPITLADHNVVVSESFGDTNVLGMNFLDSLDSWKVENNVMTLQP